jgi:hypothetical protein
MATSTLRSGGLAADSHETTLKTANGGWVTIDAPGAALSGKWDSTIRVRVKRPYAGVASGLQLRQLHIAPTGNYDRVIEKMIFGTVVQRVRAQGGEFVIARGQPGRQGIVYWRGPWHEIAAWLLPNQDSRGSDALRLLEGLDFVDAPGGLSVLPRLPAAESVEVLDACARVPGVGWIDVYPAAAQMIGLVPAWSGAKVKAGEVWRKRPPNGGVSSFVLAGHSAISVINPEGWIDKPLRERRALDFINLINEVSWEELPQ